MGCAQQRVVLSPHATSRQRHTVNMHAACCTSPAQTLNLSLPPLCPPLRLVGKALHDGQLIDAYFTRSFYKHMLGQQVGGLPGAGAELWLVFECVCAVLLSVMCSHSCSHGFPHG